MGVADKEEYLKVLDENGNYTGKMELRSIIHENNLFHNEVALLIIDKPNRRMLMERRSPNKKYGPNKLGLVAGHVVENEGIEEALKKEVFEEIGLDITKIKYQKLTVLKRVYESNYCFLHVYYTYFVPNIADLKIQEDEVSELVWMDYDALKGKCKNFDPGVTLDWLPHHQQLFNELDKLLNNQ